MKAPIERIWQLTQDPALHQRWDLRFTTITYLPRKDAKEPQRFLYTTRIGFGFAIAGVGESVTSQESEGGARISSLRFSSQEALSLIAEGSGYWKYLPSAESQKTTFLTWYDYRTRYGTAGRVVDMVVRPLMGWATAWSFDRL